MKESNYFEIKLKDLRFFANHGLMDFEREAGNEFIVNLTVNIAFDKEICLDEIKGSISYVDLFNIIKEEMSIPRNLLEKVAYDIGEKIKERFEKAISGIITIEKLRPPIVGMIGSAAVAFHF